MGGEARAHVSRILSSEGAHSGPTRTQLDVEQGVRQQSIAPHEAASRRIPKRRPHTTSTATISASPSQPSCRNSRLPAEMQQHQHPAVQDCVSQGFQMPACILHTCPGFNARSAPACSRAHARSMPNSTLGPADRMRVKVVLESTQQSTRALRRNRTLSAFSRAGPPQLTCDSQLRRSSTAILYKLEHHGRSKSTKPAGPLKVHWECHPAIHLRKTSLACFLTLFHCNLSQLARLAVSRLSSPPSVLAIIDMNIFKHHAACKVRTVCLCPLSSPGTPPGS